MIVAVILANRYWTWIILSVTIFFLLFIFTFECVNRRIQLFTSSLLSLEYSVSTSLRSTALAYIALHSLFVLLQVIQLVILHVLGILGILLYYLVIPLLYLLPLIPLSNSLFSVFFHSAPSHYIQLKTTLMLLFFFFSSLFSFHNPTVINSTRDKPYLKLYLLYWLMMLFLIFTKLFILVWIYIDFYVIAIHTTGINLSILLIIIFVSNVVLMNAIDYLAIIESVLFLVYIRPLQFSLYCSTNMNIVIL